MATSSPHFPHSNDLWFDATNPEPLHEALRADFARTKAAISRRPSLVRHMAACADCQAIAGATAAAPPPSTTRKRLKLVLTKARMHEALRLPDSFEIVHMYADNDPNTVSVLVAGEGLPQADPDAETSAASWDVGT